MNKEIQFLLENLTVVFKGIDRYTVLIELDKGIPVAAYLLKLPDPYLRCHIGPITLN